MKVELKQQFQIESARFLPHLPSSHPCSRIHGHSFRITLIFFGETDPKLGWLIDYHEIISRSQPVLHSIDHRVLNEVPGLENPTTENLCYWLFQQLKPMFSALQAIEIQETSTSTCRYSEG